MWLAEDERLARRVAVKVLRTLLAGAGDFEREVAILSSFRHPNIVTVYDVGEDDGLPFIVMEYVEGRSLRDRLREGPIAALEAARIGSAIASALAYAHAHGVLHNDVKPENILFDGDGQPRLTDFGIARVTGETLAPAEAGEIIGTLPYLAPEVLQGSGARAGADVYSLAVTLYESVAGRLPFDGPSTAALLGQKLDPSLSHSLNLPAPRTLDRALASAMSFAPADRPEAATFARLLASITAQPGSEMSRSSHRETERLRAVPLAPARRRWHVLGLAAVAGMGMLLAMAVAAPWERSGPAAEGRSPSVAVQATRPPAPTPTASPAVQVQPPASSGAPVSEPNDKAKTGNGKSEGRGNKQGKR